MENNSVGSKIGNFLRKMYHFRVKVDRKGKPVVNVSSIFGALCLIFAPHMTIIGLVAALLLGYQIHFESEADDGLLGDQIRKAADNIRTGAVNAAKSIQQEIDRARTNNTHPGRSRRSRRRRRAFLPTMTC